MAITNKENLQLGIRKEINKRSFYDFVQWAVSLIEPSTNWKWNFHHQYICNLLQNETIRIKEGRPRDKHIIINVPFRSSKSLIVSILYPIWSWIIYPNMSFINLSYSDNLSTGHSNKVFALLHHPKFKMLYDWPIDENQRSKTDFKLKIGGERLSGGMTGTVLGKGGDVIIMDDPNNTRRLSEVERNNTINAWKDTISTRLNDPVNGLFIVIQQRLHQYDLSGYLLDNETDAWDNIVLPAELSPRVSPSYLAESYRSNLLWPDRFTREVLDRYKVSLGSIGYANQLQQETVPESGNIIKKDWIDTITYEKFQELFKLKSTNQLTGKENRSIITWDLFLDTAYTSKQKNDPSAILVACKLNNKVYVRKAFEVRLEFPELILKINAIANLYCNSKSRIFVEPKASGLDIVNTLRKESKLNMIKLESPKDDKETRLNAVAPMIESGRLVLIEDITNELVINQLTGFPNAIHDDILDTVVYALSKYISRSNSFNYLMM